jgi:hypothetical protein
MVKNNPEIVAKGATRGWRSRRLLLQAGGAVLLSAPFYLLLIVVHKPFPAGFAYPEQAIGRWALFVCLLLTFWSLVVLFADWWNGMNRQRAIAGTSIPPSASLRSAEGVREVMDAARAAAVRHGDGMLARRIEKAIARFQSLDSAAAAAEELATAGDADLAELEAGHTPVRLFLYAIPILGLAGTVMSIRQTLEQAALSPSPAPQQLDAIRVALTRITSSLAGSFDTALLALVLSLVVMVALTWVVEKEKSLLLAIDDFCRTHLLPLMQPVEAQPAGALAAREETLLGVLTDLRSALDGKTRNGDEMGAAQSLKPAEGEGPFASALDRLRGELSDRGPRPSELGNQYLEQRPVTSLDFAQRFDELRELLSVRQENLATVQPSAPRRRSSSDAASATAAHVDDLSAALEDLRDSIREMDSFLQRLAQRLRSQTEEPVVVKVMMMPGTSSTPANN